MSGIDKCYSCGEPNIDHVSVPIEDDDYVIEDLSCGSVYKCGELAKRIVHKRWLTPQPPEDPCTEEELREISS